MYKYLLCFLKNTLFILNLKVPVSFLYYAEKIKTTIDLLANIYLLLIYYFNL